jgi:hypothetical protein
MWLVDNDPTLYAERLTHTELSSTGLTVATGDLR